MNGQVHVYTGRGKGKTTAALGLCLRASGHGMRVAFVQFQKHVTCGEHTAGAKLGFHFVQCPVGRSGPCSSPCPIYASFMEILSCGEYGVIVMDEIMAAIKRGCVSVPEVLAAIDARPYGTELVLTGRDAPLEIEDRANLVTRMEMVKHYYAAGLPAREGIEY